MKKLFNVFLLVIIFSSILVLEDNLIPADKIETRPEVKRIVTVGYNVKDKKEIFGDLSDEEIDEILQKKAEELMKKGETDLQNIENKNSIDLDSKLIISVSDKDSNCDNLD